MTLGAAYALRGKVYLYTKEYAKAAKDFEEIILDPSGKGYNYSLYADYAKLFTSVLLNPGITSSQSKGLPSLYSYMPTSVADGSTTFQQLPYVARLPI